jgi:hypothetical protein
MSGNESFHVQCRMKRKNANQTSYIPEQFARVGNIVKLKDQNGVWEDGWVIFQCGPRVLSAVVNERGQDYKRTRKASDI